MARGMKWYTRARVNVVGNDRVDRNEVKTTFQTVDDGASSY